MKYEPEQNFEINQEVKCPEGYDELEVGATFTIKTVSQYADYPYLVKFENGYETVLKEKEIDELKLVPIKRLEAVKEEIAVLQEDIARVSHKEVIRFAETKLAKLQEEKEELLRKLKIEKTENKVNEKPIPEKPVPPKIKVVYEGFRVKTSEE